jgi:hypothetical protein
MRRDDFPCRPGLQKIAQSFSSGTTFPSILSPEGTKGKGRKPYAMSVVRKNPFPTIGPGHKGDSARLQPVLANRNAKCQMLGYDPKSLVLGII